ncbi:MAG TPA: 2-C-methyl-D-erythritol 4-phosphate cytidylyltransferase [Candidatus Limnocylindrales bacterium]|nr:2-C-methyl-D-erythritol 4-phosphate cytidylyltransferase [Candidatus Limnocylindrales bacterium]
MTRGHADVVVVAAGTSQRFGSDKLEADVAGRPLLAWTIDRLAASPLVERIVVVTTAERVDDVRDAPWLSPKVAGVVAGGARRQDSVAAGLGAVAELDAAVPDESDDRVVLVHDGARPLVSPGLIESVIDAVRTYGAAVPVLPLVETVKRAGPDGRILETVDRTGLSVAQTPQGATLGSFVRALLDDGLSKSGREFTDEAALLEACRIAVHAIPGDPSNLKVTLPGDLARVEAALTGRSPASPGVRVGLGRDSHPFGPGSPLALGGLAIAGAPRLSGHSDGDVALHAIADAILGAAGLGDLGRLFPAGPETPAGIASSELLTAVVARASAAGLRVANVDVTIVAARPRLGDVLEGIGRRVAELLEMEPRQVNVKASTGNLAGMEGAGRGISAQAVVTLVASG